MYEYGFLDSKVDPIDDPVRILYSKYMVCSVCLVLSTIVFIKKTNQSFYSYKCPLGHGTVIRELQAHVPHKVCYVCNISEEDADKYENYRYWTILSCPRG